MSINIWDVYAHSYDVATLSFSAYKELLQIVGSEIQFKDGDVVINAGCGSGNLEASLKLGEEKFSWVGKDISRSMLHLAKKKVKDERFVFIPTDLNQSFPEDNTSVDTVIFIHSLYPLADVKNVLAECKRVLKPGGKLLVVNPKQGASMGKMFTYELHKHSIMHFTLLILRTLPALLINMVISSRANKSHYHFLTEEELREKIESVGLKIQSSRLVYAEQSILFVAQK